MLFRINKKEAFYEYLSNEYFKRHTGQNLVTETNTTNSPYNLELHKYDIYPIKLYHNPKHTFIETSLRIMNTDEEFKNTPLGEFGGFKQIISKVMRYI